MVASTMLLVWSLSSLLITHRLLRQEPATTSQEAGDSSSQETADTSHHTQGGRRRQVVRGWWDFRGELLQVRSLFALSADRLLFTNVTSRSHI